jgi:hypothetical protein
MKLLIGRLFLHPSIMSQIAGIAHVGRPSTVECTSTEKLKNPSSYNFQT